MKIIEEELVYLGGITDFGNFRPEPGKIYKDLPNSVYHSLTDWESSSTIKNADRSVEYWREQKTAEPKTSLALEKGSAFHHAMELIGNGISFDDVRNRIRVFDGVRIPNKEFDKTKSEFPDHPVIPIGELKSVRRMAENAAKIASESKILENGYYELSFFWIDELTGIKCKCRPDFIHRKMKMIVDFKSTSDHSRAGFAKSCANFGYHISQSFYTRGVNEVLSDDYSFCFLVVNSSSPHEALFYNLGDKSIVEGDIRVSELLTKIATEEQPEIYNEIDLPGWAFK